MCKNNEKYTHSHNPARAEYALGLFQQLYDIERRIKSQPITGDAIIQLRQQEAIPILRALKTWMEAEYVKILVKKSPIAQAMGLLTATLGEAMYLHKRCPLEY